MIIPEKIRNLPVSAASGLIIVGEYLYVIADDDLQLSVFSLLDKTFHKTIALFEGRLPSEKNARKKKFRGLWEVKVIMSLRATAGSKAILNTLFEIASSSRLWRESSQ